MRLELSRGDSTPRRIQRDHVRNRCAPYAECSPCRSPSVIFRVANNASPARMSANGLTTSAASSKQRNGRSTGRSSTSHTDSI